MVAVDRVLAATTAALATICTTTTILPANVSLTLGNASEPVILQQPVTVTIPCPTLVARETPPPTEPASAANAEATMPDNGSLSPDPSTSGSKYSDFRDPFYASTFPICYALAATTVTSYILVIMLFVTPRSFLDGGVVRLNRRSFTSSSTQGISIGGRPILQKVAAITVAASLTLATTSTFNIAETQYHWGVQNAKVLQDKVLNGTDIKVIRLISDSFLWLAQAQTLIRLFPRQREKVIIKWAAFFLIILDVVFSGVNSFVYANNGVSGSSKKHIHDSLAHSIPTLSYIFQLSLGALYALWIMYYALTKRRYAFYHPLMKNICLVAAISLVSVVIPIVFFVVDISKPNVTAWGDYVRWVGAAAASVVVWEWVERIEALERDEKKDGILGREVFDGDDTLEVGASGYQHLHKKARTTDSSGSDGTGGNREARHSPTEHAGSSWPGVASIANRYRGGNQDRARDGRKEPSHLRLVGEMLRPPLWPTRPQPVATPVSRADTPSAASTVYAVRYQPASDTTTQSPEPMREVRTQPPMPVGQNDATLFRTAARRSADNEASRTAASGNDGRRPVQLTTLSGIGGTSEGADGNISTFGRSAIGVRTGSSNHAHRDDRNRWDIKSRFQDMAATQAERLRDKFKPATDTASLPVKIIPAPARRGAALQQVLEEEEANNRRQAANLSSMREGSRP